MPARRTPRPSHAPFEAQLATLVTSPPDGDAWLHEVKYDGYRIGCSIRGADVRLESRNGQDWTQRFDAVAKAARALALTSATLDGEVCILDAQGRSSFQALQNAARSGQSSAPLVYFVFDLLEHEGRDLRANSLEERKAALEALLTEPAKSIIRYAPHFLGLGAKVLAQACKLGLEGIVSKRRDAPYRAGRNTTWLKSKCLKRQEFVVGGFTEPEGSRAGLGSLLLGVYDEVGALRFAGKAGNGPGFTAAHLMALRRDLQQLEAPSCPFTPAPPRSIARRAHWLRPERLVEVSFTEWTEGGAVRHPLILGLRTDKRATDVRRELAIAAPSDSPAQRTARRSASERAVVEGVPISSPERMLFPRVGITKLALAEYYRAVAPWMLPHVRQRPLTLVRCEAVTSDAAFRAECSFLKHGPEWHRWASDALERLQIREQKKVGEYLVANSPAALVALVQGDIVEVHSWGSSAPAIEQPDRLVFDLDPGEDVAWPDVVDAAHFVRGVLEDVGLHSWPKLTGGKGVHLVSPLAPELGWAALYKAAALVATTITARQPKRFTTDFAKNRRRGLILIDYKRNHRTATTIAPYSTRAAPDAPVALPVRWSELKASLPPNQFTVDNVLPRLKRLRRDPWHDFWGCSQTLRAKP